MKFHFLMTARFRHPATRVTIKRNPSSNKCGCPQIKFLRDTHSAFRGGNVYSNALIGPVNRPIVINGHEFYFDLSSQLAKEGVARIGRV
jgi:hypothetical protein